MPKLSSIRQYGEATFILIIALASFTAVQRYPGNPYVYLLFSVATNALLYMGFRKQAIFFDAFIGVFFWMGFWLKLTIRMVFFEGQFSEAVGAFDYSPASYDHALWVSICGISGLLLASTIRERLLFTYRHSERPLNKVFFSNLYLRYRNVFLLIFFVVFLSVALLNALLGIYQKGSITQTNLPWGLNGVFKWLLLFGLASFSAIILKFELVAKKEISSLVILLVLLESFSTNTSLLSRGMVLNIGALAYGVYVYCRIEFIAFRCKSIVLSFLLFSALFAASIFVVNDLRGNGTGYVRQFMTSTGSVATSSDSDAIQHATPLFLNRWVGMEGVMAVSSSSRLGWDLWRDAWKEKYSETTMGFYDANLIDSPYKYTDFSKHHHLSLPGILAFFFYPGSFVFLFVAMLLLGIVAAGVEFTVFQFGGRNLILCALMSEVIAYRYVSFGYVPGQSYLLFGTIFLNTFIFYCIYWVTGFFIVKNNIQNSV